MGLNMIMAANIKDLKFFRSPKKKNLLTVLGSLLLIIFIAIGVYIAQKPQKPKVGASGVILTLGTTNTNPKVGDTFVASVAMDTQGLSVNGAEVRINFDKNKLIANSITAGNMLPNVLIDGYVDNNVGFAVIVVGCTITGSSPFPATGAGLVAQVSFTAKAAGTTSITFDSSNLVSVSGQTSNMLGATYPEEITIVENVGVNLSISNPTTTPLKVNDVFTLNVNADTQGLLLNGADVRLKFDPSRLTAISMQAGSFLPNVFISGTVDNTNGTAMIIVGCSIDENGTHPASGTGTIAQITFKAKAEGSTTVEFGTQTVVSASGRELNALGIAAPAQITILSNSTPTPTPTASPSPSPSISPSPTGIAQCTQDSDCREIVCPGGGFIHEVCIDRQCILQASCDGASASPTPYFIPGDIDRDGDVDIVDVGLLVDNYDLSPPFPDPRADIDSDGDVDIVDVGLLIDNYQM